MPGASNGGPGGLVRAAGTRRRPGGGPARHCGLGPRAAVRAVAPVRHGPERPLVPGGSGPGPAQLGPYFKMFNTPSHRASFVVFFTVLFMMNSHCYVPLLTCHQTKYFPRAKAGPRIQHSCHKYRSLGQHRKVSSLVGNSRHFRQIIGPGDALITRVTCY